MLYRSSKNASFKVVEVVRYVGLIVDKQVSSYFTNDICQELNHIKNAWTNYHMDQETREVVLGVLNYINRKKDDGSSYIYNKITLNDIAMAIDIYINSKDYKLA